MKRILISIRLSAVLFILPLILHAQEQEQEKMTFRDRVYFGGDFSLQIGRMTFIEASPIIGYYITPRLSSGIGVTYQYYRERSIFDTIFKAHNYGGRVFSKYLLVDNISKYIPLQMHAGILGYCEYELLSMDSIFSRYNLSQRFWLHSFYVGGGLELPVSRRAKMNFLVLWNLNDTGESPYSNPAVRIGVTF